MKEDKEKKQKEKLEAEIARLKIMQEFEEKYKAFTYIADVVSYTYFGTKTTPLDAADYAPSIFANEEDHHWLKLANIRPISLDELNTFEMVNKKVQAQYNGVGNYIKNTGRLQVFYAKKTF